MKILVTVKRVEDYESKIKVKPDNSWTRADFGDGGFVQPGMDVVDELRRRHEDPSRSGCRAEYRFSGGRIRSHLDPSVSRCAKGTVSRGAETSDE